MKIRQELPKAQIEIIQEALRLFEFSIITFLKTEVSINQSNRLFDILQLRGMLAKSVIVEMTEEEYNNFTHDHGVDFPEYIE